MLTTKGEEVNRVQGFEVGTDDYIVKPFSPREVVLRVKASYAVLYQQHSLHKIQRQRCYCVPSFNN